MHIKFTIFQHNIPVTIQLKDNNLICENKSTRHWRGRRCSADCGLKCGLKCGSCGFLKYSKLLCDMWFSSTFLCDMRFIDFFVRYSVHRLFLCDLRFQTKKYLFNLCGLWFQTDFWQFLSERIKPCPKCAIMFSYLRLRFAVSAPLVSKVLRAVSATPLHSLERRMGNRRMVSKVQKWWLG